MSNFIKNVAEFNSLVLGISGRDLGLLNHKELEYAGKAILEESDEFGIAHTRQDMIAAVDAVCDLMYFSVGFLIRMGLSADQIDECLEAVHKANMAKSQGAQAKRAGEGVIDAVKPEGWSGPEEAIAHILGR